MPHDELSQSWLSRAAVAALTLVLIGWLGGFIQQNAVFSFDSDEGIHAYEALRLSAYLRDGDLAGALASSLRQSFYPPVHPWLLSVALIFLPATHATVRLFSLAIYALVAFLLYALGQSLARDTRYAWLAGLATALPALAASPLWVMGSLAYLEMLGVLFVLLTFWGYWQGVAGREWGWLVAGLGILATGLTKYPYWLFLIVPLPLALTAQMLISSGSASRWRTLLGRLARMALPSAVVMLAWAAWPVTRNGLASYIAATRDLAQTAHPLPLRGTLGAFSDHFIFYLRSIWLQFSSSPLAAVGLAAAWVISATRWRDDKLRPLVFFFIWHLVSVSTHGGLAPRFLVTAMPALWLMGGVWAARAAEAWPPWIARWKVEGARHVRLRAVQVWIAQFAAWVVIAALALSAILGVVKRVTLYPTLYMLSLETDPRAMDLYRWTASVLPAGPARVGLVNDWDQMNGSALGWELTTYRTATPHKADLVTVWEMHRLPEPTAENVAAVRDQMNARGLNTLIAYTAPGVGIKRWQGTLALLSDNTRLLGERDFPLRWYWPDKIERRLYDGEYLDNEQLQQAVDDLGTERSLTVHACAYGP